MKALKKKRATKIKNGHLQIQKLIILRKKIDEFLKTNINDKVLVSQQIQNFFLKKEITSFNTRIL